MAASLVEHGRVAVLQELLLVVDVVVQHEGFNGAGWRVLLLLVVIVLLAVDVLQAFALLLQHDDFSTADTVMAECSLVEATVVTFDSTTVSTFFTHVVMILLVVIVGPAVVPATIVHALGRVSLLVQPVEQHDFLTPDVPVTVFWELLQEGGCSAVTG